MECSQHSTGGWGGYAAFTSFPRAFEPGTDDLHLIVREPEFAVLDVLNQSANPVELRTVHGGAVLGLDEEEPGDPHRLLRVLEPRFDSSNLAFEQAAPHAEQAHDLLLVQRGEESQRRGKLRVLVHRLRQHLAEPGCDLLATGLGDGVDRPLWAAPFAAWCL